MYYIPYILVVVILCSTVDSEWKKQRVVAGRATGNGVYAMQCDYLVVCPCIKTKKALSVLIRDEAPADGMGLFEAARLVGYPMSLPNLLVVHCQSSTCITRR